MKALTQEQADALREHRPKVKQLTRMLDELASALCDLCDHKDFNQNCYVCRVYRPLARSANEIDGNETKNTLAALWDDALEHGPMPKEKT